MVGECSQLHQKRARSNKTYGVAQYQRVRAQDSPGDAEQGDAEHLGPAARPGAAELEDEAVERRVDGRGQGQEDAQGDGREERQENERGDGQEVEQEADPEADPEADQEADQEADPEEGLEEGREGRVDEGVHGRCSGGWAALRPRSQGEGSGAGTRLAEQERAGYRDVRWAEPW